MAMFKVRVAVTRNHLKPLIEYDNLVAGRNIDFIVVEFYAAQPPIPAAPAPVDIHIVPIHWFEQFVGISINQVHATVALSLVATAHYRRSDQAGHAAITGDLCIGSLFAGYVIEYKANAIFITAIDDPMRFLVVDFVSLADFHTIGTTVNHKANLVVGRNRYVDTMALVKRLMMIRMRGDGLASREFGGHRADDGAPGGIYSTYDLVH